jgi:xanthine dehydrogenase molybdopterin-binding subunit B
MDGGYGDLDMLMLWADTVYNFPNYNAQGYVCKTNLAAVTSTRAPGVPQSIFAMESIMDQLAVKLDMDPYALRQANFVAVGDTTPYGQEIQYCSLPTVWQQTMEQSKSVGWLRHGCWRVVLTCVWVQNVAALTRSKPVWTHSTKQIAGASVVLP